MSDYPKPIKRLLRQYLTLAYERELHRELAKLDQSFAEWREGKINNGELSHRVHQYEMGPSRDLFKRYNGDLPDMMVAYALVAGILKQEEVPAELLEAIARTLSFYQSLKERNELKEPDIEG